VAKLIIVSFLSSLAQESALMEGSSWWQSRDASVFADGKAASNDGEVGEGDEVGGIG
jgi:hypothetical protein